MKYKTLARLGVRILGFYLMAEGAASAIHVILLSFGMLVGPQQQWWSWWSSVTMLASPLTYLGIGCYLFLSGEWVVNKIIPSNRPYCPECGYELTGLTKERCPECGVLVPTGLVGRES